MKPVWGVVAIVPDEVEKVTKGGIVIPDDYANKEQRAQMIGTIHSFGGNCFETWKGVKPEVGERVIYNRYAGFTLNINNQEYRCINDDDIHVVLEEGDEQTS